MQSESETAVDATKYCPTPHEEYASSVHASAVDTLDGWNVPDRHSRHAESVATVPAEKWYPALQEDCVWLRQAVAVKV